VNKIKKEINTIYGYFLILSGYLLV